MYLMWQDTDPKRPLQAKLADACAAYAARFGVAPNVVRLSVAEASQAPAMDGVVIEAAATVQRGVYWAGHREAA